jgi:CelD/BcsL family acetyltransferase involved in cellulose biosynthesis
MAAIRTAMTTLEAVGATEWDALAATNTVRTIFQSHAWHRAWWEVHGEQHELALLEAREGGRLVGIAPLVVDREGVLRFMGYGASDYLDLLVEGARRDILDALASAMRAIEWKRMLLEQVHEGSPLVTCALVIPSYVESQQPAPSYRFRHDDSDRQLANKKSLKRHYNYFQRSGAITFDVLSEAPAVEPHLENFFAQHVARRGLTDAPSKFSDDRERAFYRKLTQYLGSSGHLRFSVLGFGDEVLAYHFGFEFDGTLYWYKPTFNVGFEKHSPGEVLLKLIIEDCIERDLDELDFTIGKEAFKYRFANQERTVFRVAGFRSRTRLFIERKQRELRRRLRTMRGANATPANSAGNGAGSNGAPETRTPHAAAS